MKTTENKMTLRALKNKKKSLVKLLREMQIINGSLVGRKQ